MNGVFFLKKLVDTSVDTQCRYYLHEGLNTIGSDFFYTTNENIAANHGSVMVENDKISLKSNSELYYRRKDTLLITTLTSSACTEIYSGDSFGLTETSHWFVLNYQPNFEIIIDNNHEFEMYYLSNNTADFSFIITSPIDNELITVPGHKMVLSKHDFFKELFNSNFGQRETNQLEIVDCSKKGFECFLQFLYLKKVFLNGLNICEVTIMVDKYLNAPAYLGKCTDILLETLNVRSMFHYYQLQNIQPLQGNKKIQNFVAKHANEIFLSPEFVKTSIVMITEILKYDHLTCGEFKIFKFAMEWAKNQCRIQRIPNSMQNCRHVLDQAFYLIRFPIMSYGELRHIYDNYTDLLNEKEFNHFLFYLAGQETATANKTVTNFLMKKRTSPTKSSSNECSSASTSSSSKVLSLHPSQSDEELFNT